MLASGIGGGGGSNTEGNNSPVERRSEGEKGMLVGGERMAKLMMMPMSKSRQMSIHTNAFLTTDCGGMAQLGAERTANKQLLGYEEDEDDNGVLSGLKYHEDIFSTLTESNRHLRAQSN